MSVRSTAVVAVLGALALAGCTSSKPKAAETPRSSAPSGVSSNPTLSAPSGGGDCGQGLHTGKGGVVQVFCDGTATVHVTAGPTNRTLRGGTCVTAHGRLAINAGAIVGIDFPASKSKPDFVGVLIEPRTTTVDAFTAFVGGKGGVVQAAKATLGAGDRSAHLTGTLPGLGAVSADVTC